MQTDPKLEMALAIVKRFYPEMPADYRGRRVQIALSAIEECTERAAKLAEYRGPWGDAHPYGGDHVAELIRAGDHLKGPTDA